MLETIYQWTCIGIAMLFAFAFGTIWAARKASSDASEPDNTPTKREPPTQEEVNAWKLAQWKMSRSREVDRQVQNWIDDLENKINRQ